MILYKILCEQGLNFLFLSLQLLAILGWISYNKSNRHVG